MLTKTERIQTVVIGAGQAGLSTGYYLARRGLPFVILEANPRVGDSWRRRWDSLRLFTPARFDGIAGMPFPAPPHSFPTKNEMADYLESYAARFALPVRTGVDVRRLSREGDRYRIETDGPVFEAEHVVVAMATFQRPKVPPFAGELDPGIVQLHSSEYRHPGQWRPGSVLVVGAGNSGSELAMEAARDGRQVWLAGRDTGHVPFRIEGSAGRLLLPFVFRVVFHRLLTVDTPIGRKARPAAVNAGRSADPGQAEGSLSGGRAAGRSGDGDAKRSAGDRRRRGDRARERRLVHRLPSGPLLGGSAGLRPHPGSRVRCAAW